jgi:metallophosphoesterase (TIGR00282 family)
MPNEKAAYRRFLFSEELEARRMRVLMIGDVVGSCGRSALRNQLPRLNQSLQPDVIIANGENAAGGRGITRAILRELYDLGIDCVTLGNHAWDQREIFDFIDDESRLIRPANYPEGTPGRGVAKIPVGQEVLAVINLMGRTFMPMTECPFRVADALLQELEDIPFILVDFHAETTSEKQAMAWHLDGRVSAVIGTHTHVQTADERILPSGTAYLTDVGMVGAYNGVIGMDRNLVLKKFQTQLPVRLETETGPAQLNAVVIDLDPSGCARQIRRIRIDHDHPFMD